MLKNEKWYEVITDSSKELVKVEYLDEISYKACSLENRIEQYIKWYLKNMLVKSDKVKKEIEKEKLLNFIEKMAIWYELRYPDLKLDDLILSKNSKTSNNDDYNTFFINLSAEEQLFLTNPSYPRSVYLSERSGRHFHLSKNGIIEYDEYSPDKLKFKGKRIEDVWKYLKECGISGYELDKAVNDYKRDLYKKEELLNCVMYRLIERGKIKGSKRAFLFACEFNLSKSIPIKYLISEDDLIKLDETKKKFINEYLRLDGSIYTPCYPNYHMKNKSVGVVSLIDVISNLGEDKNLIKLQILNLLKNILLERKEEINIEPENKILTKK